MTDSVKFPVEECIHTFHFFRGWFLSSSRPKLSLLLTFDQPTNCRDWIFLGVQGQAGLKYQLQPPQSGRLLVDTVVWNKIPSKNFLFGRQLHEHSTQQWEKNVTNPNGHWKRNCTIFRKIISATKILLRFWPMIVRWCCNVYVLTPLKEPDSILAHVILLKIMQLLTPIEFLKDV